MSLQFKAFSFLILRLRGQKPTLDCLMDIGFQLLECLALRETS